MFAVTAITGKVGGAVARSLLAAGERVRAVVRDEAKGTAWATLGCEVAVADLSDAPRLAAAFAGAEGVFVLLPPMFDPQPDFSEVKAAISVIHEGLVRSAPPKVVVLSTIGADADRPNLLNALRYLEQALAGLPMPVAFLRAAWFMENAEWDISSAQSEGLIHSYLQPLDRPVAMIATDDVGRVAADLLRESWTGHRVVELEGSERVSPDMIANAFSRALGKPVEAHVVPRAHWERIFREQGMQNPLPRMQMIDGFNEGWIDFNGDVAATRDGTITIEEAIAGLIGKQAQRRIP
jgi:uncharacterized protein YbjT (DUF2867 family)